MAVIETVHGQVENDDKASVNNANRLTLDRYPPTMLAHVLILTDSRLHHFKRNLLIISRNMLLYIAIYNCNSLKTKWKSPAFRPINADPKELFVSLLEAHRVNLTTLET